MGRSIARRGRGRCGRLIMSSERAFNKVAPAIWRSQRFMALSAKGKVLHLYLLTNAHVTSAGCYELPDGYACADLGWSADEYGAARDEVQRAGLIDMDEHRPIILIERWFRHNPPMNDKHAKGTLRFIEAIESDRLRERALSACNDVDGPRQERQAAREAEKEAAKIAASLPGNSHHLTSTRFMRRAG